MNCKFRIYIGLIATAILTVRIFHLLCFTFRAWDACTKLISVCLSTRLPHLKCIRLGSVRLSHLPFEVSVHEVGYVRSSPTKLMHVGVNNNTFLFTLTPRDVFLASKHPEAKIEEAVFWCVYIKGYWIHYAISYYPWTVLRYETLPLGRFHPPVPSLLRIFGKWGIG